MSTADSKKTVKMPQGIVKLVTKLKKSQKFWTISLVASFINPNTPIFASLSSTCASIVSAAILRPKEPHKFSSVHSVFFTISTTLVSHECMKVLHLTTVSSTNHSRTTLRNTHRQILLSHPLRAAQGCARNAQKVVKN